MNIAINIRTETSADYAAITRVNDLAFGRPEEGQLVENLRTEENFEPQLSLVAAAKGNIVGHIVLLPVTIQGADKIFTTLSLGPIAVIPEVQSQGIGGQLIETSHQAALELGYDSVVLLGHPGYYPRFGYRLANLWGLINPWSFDDEPWMAIELVPGALAGKAGLVQYPKVFNATT
jgi:putative acetyltransferase